MRNFGNGDGNTEADEDHVEVRGGAEFVGGEADAGVHGFEFTPSDDSDTILDG